MHTRSDLVILRSLLAVLALVALGCRTTQPDTGQFAEAKSQAPEHASAPQGARGANTNGNRSAATAAQVNYEQALPFHGRMANYMPHPPRELHKAMLPEYVIEPPDILNISALQVIPKEPYSLRTGDSVALQILVTAGLEGGGAPVFPNISDTFVVGFGGVVDLGIPYGQVKLAGFTSQQAEAEILDRLKKIIKEEFIQLVSVSVVAPAGSQQIQGEHLVGPDGAINLGLYGKLPIVGLTIPQATQAIEAHLSQFLQDPRVAVDVFAYNSKVYYIVTAGAGLGDTLTRAPYMGNETVLDALSSIGGFGEVSSKRMWIARPGRNQEGKLQILPIDYEAIAKWGDPTTNYQLMPGDRLFIAEDKRVWLDTSLAKLIAPIERAMGFSLLGANTITRFSGRVLAGGGARGFFGGQAVAPAP